MKIYISGPMRGYPNHNKEAFYYAEGLLRARYPDAEIFNPARLDNEDPLEEGATARDYARRDLREILDSTHIYMLRGWGESLGARAEFAVAEWIGLAEAQEGVPPLAWQTS